MSDAEPSFSPYEDLLAALGYALRRYPPDSAPVVEWRHVRDAKRAAERDEAETAHTAALTAATGLRRAVLELHAPTFEGIGSNPGCSHCEDSEWGSDDWPCETYVLARDFPGDAA